MVGVLASWADPGFLQKLVNTCKQFRQTLDQELQCWHRNILFKSYQSSLCNKLSRFQKDVGTNLERLFLEMSKFSQDKSAKLPCRCPCQAMAFLLTPFCRCAAGASGEAALEDGDKNDIKQEGSCIWESCWLLWSTTGQSFEACFLMFRLNLCETNVKCDVLHMGCGIGLWISGACV